MSKKRQSDLRGFLCAKKTKTFSEPTTASVNSTGLDLEVHQKEQPDSSENAESCEFESQPGTSKDLISPTLVNSVSNFQKYDIGLFSKNCTDKEKYNFLKNTWNPSINYKFPPGQRNLKFQHQWLSEFQWLAYSEAKEGAFCKLCKIFASDFESGKGSHVQLGSIVKTPFTKWKNAKQEFREHEQKSYHQNACLKSQNFLSVFDKKVEDVHIQVNSHLKNTIEENKKKLCPIIKTVLFCGRECIALRGHRDHGPMSFDESSCDGKFRSLLRFRMDAGDDILTQHINSAGANANYLSKRIQNEIIDTAGDLITNTLIDRIKTSQVFCILADETSDVSGTEQMSLCARYLDKVNDNYVVREDFLKFVPVYDLRGFALSNVIKESITNLGLDLNSVRGLGFDGASNMSGIFNGCAAKFQQSYPQAIYVHCASHSLNLALSHSCTIPEVRNCLGTINKIINFFRSSCKREKVLKDKILQVDSLSKRTRLIKFCETRWVERLDSIALFCEMFPHIFESLNEIQNNDDSETSSQAFAFSAAMQKPIFIASMIVAFHVFNLSMGLATHLQTKQIDLKKCIDSCERLVNELQQFREDFKQVYQEIEAVADLIGAKIDIPRTAGKQMHRSNIMTTIPEDYYRATVFNPFIDYVLAELYNRFLNHKQILKTIQILLPRSVVKATDEDLSAAVNVFTDKWPNDVQKSSSSFFDELKNVEKEFS